MCISSPSLTLKTLLPNNTDVITAVFSPPFSKPQNDKTSSITKNRMTENTSQFVCSSFVLRIYIHYLSSHRVSKSLEIILNGEIMNSIYRFIYFILLLILEGLLLTFILI